jgi:hypothetical protein
MLLSSLSSQLKLVSAFEKTSFTACESCDKNVLIQRQFFYKHRRPSSQNLSLLEQIY